MQKAFVYILKCFDRSYYVGLTNNIEVRMIEHQTKFDLSCYTASRLPVSLVFLKQFETHDEAFLYERQIKLWSRKKKEALISGDFEALKVAAKKIY